MTDIAQLIQTESDPTWEQASLYASRYLDLPGPFAQLVRSGFQGKLDQVEFIRLLGGTRMNVGCLLQAAQIYADGRKPDVNYVMKALDQLGIPYATVVIAINLVTRLTLKRKPPGIWRGLLREAMTSVEVGVRLGEKVGSLGRHGGALMGFARFAGLQILMMHDRNAFKEWRRQEKINGKIGRKVEVNLFGCEPYQVAAVALQQLGFGVSAAAGAALGVGQLEASQLALGDDLLRWKSAVLWIDALRKGRDVPADPAVRGIFPEIAPAKNRGERNIALSVLYTEIAKAKGEGSDWVWHLPLPSYEKTAEEWHLE